jgi:hypothetical protein
MRHPSIRIESPALGLAAALVVAMFGVAACSGQSSSTVAAPPTTDGGSDPSAGAAQPSTPGGVGQTGGVLDVSKICAAVPAADVQKLFKATAPAVTANPGECDWGSGGVTVDIFQGDTDKQYYNGGAVHNGTSVTGIGDVAQWSQPVPGMTVPFLASHKGSTTCTVSPGLDVADTTMSYTGSSPFYKIPAAAALQYATAEGQICNDVFQAMG